MQVSERNSIDYGYSYEEFELMGSDSQYWASQLNTDLENIYTNDAKKVIGFYNHPEELNKFKMVLYTVEIFERCKKFDLEVEAVI